MPLDIEEFRRRGYEAVDRIADYYADIESHRVLSVVEPGYLKKLLPDNAPEDPESWDVIQADFDNKIMPGMTHWQSPNFFAFFPANSSFEGILGDMYGGMLNTIGFNVSGKYNTLCRSGSDPHNTLALIPPIRLTSAVAVLARLYRAGDHCSRLDGQADRATRAVSVGRLRWRRDPADGERGCHRGHDRRQGPCPQQVPSRRGEERRGGRHGSEQADRTHSCTHKAALIANVRFRSLPTDDDFRLRGETVWAEVQNDMDEGLIPFFLTATIGTTSSGAVDAIDEIGEAGDVDQLSSLWLVQVNGTDIWLHIDAAYAGASLICPEYQHLLKGVEHADSFDFNMHKWLLTNFDCSLLWVKDRKPLIDALSLTPAYLRTAQGDAGLVTDYKDWQLGLGRRFRSLKAWFVIRSYGAKGLREHINKHIRLASHFRALMAKHPDLLAISTPPTFALTVFNVLAPLPEIEGVDSATLTRQTLERINASGEIFLTLTELLTKYISLVVTRCTNDQATQIPRDIMVIDNEPSTLAFRSKLLPPETSPARTHLNPYTMSSRFFRAGSDSDSDSESDNESFVSDEEPSEGDESDGELAPQQEEKKNKWIGAAASDDDDSDDDRGKRKVLSKKDKRFVELESAVKAIENGRKIGDWVAISNGKRLGGGAGVWRMHGAVRKLRHSPSNSSRPPPEFDKLTKALKKVSTSSIMVKSGVPRFFIRAIVELEDYLAEAVSKEKVVAKKMGADKAKAMNVMKQKLKKNNKDYEKEIDAFRKNPVEEEEEDEIELDEEEDLIALAAAKAAAKKDRKKAQFQLSDDESREATDFAADGDDGFTPVGPGGKTVEYTAENLYKKLREVLDARGKKNTDRTEQVTVLKRLLVIAATPYSRVRVLIALISSQFDYNLSMTAFMSVELWKSAEREITQLLIILEENPQYEIRENVEEIDDDDKDLVPPAGSVLSIRGSIVSFVDRLDDEFTKSLQNIDPHTTEYVDRLKDETGLYAVIVRAQAYFEMHGMEESTCRVVMRRLEHVYYKPDPVIKQVEEAVKVALPESVSSKITFYEDPSELIHNLCVYLYKQNVSLLRTRAMLCHIYHHALHNRFYKARDMLLMSHLQESIHQADVATQILHNRTMVQVGLCAFREGMIKEAQSCLQEISGSGRPKELLAQGLQLQRYAQLPPEQEKLDRQRQLPFHMHINLELLECVYLTCSMLLEIPSMAAAGPDAKKKVISKPFRRLLEYNERQVFSGPPENTRDHIMGAAKSLAAGEWKKSRELIMAIKIWDLMPEQQQIKDMLARKIQEEGLRTYLFTYSSYYTTLGLQQLSSMFDLPLNNVAAIVAKMIWNEEIAASLDQIKQCVVLHQVEASRVQVLSLQFADKAAALVEQNERLLEQKTLENKPERKEKGKGERGQNPQQRGQSGGQRAFQQRTGGRNNFNNGLGNSSLSTTTTTATTTTTTTTT
ncbi:eukaryotic translation initiation factor 3 subunit 8 N-terminus-domain-containing protein, partial [Jimgerdemannia flammicorona]